MIKLIASDVDGTLIKVGTRVIDRRYYEAIEALHSLGIAVAIASGRQNDSIEALFAPVREYTYFISNNGSNIVYNGEMIYQRELPSEVIKPLCEDLRAITPDVLITADYGYFFPDISNEFYRFATGYGFGVKAFTSYEDIHGAGKVCVFDKRIPHPALSLVGKYDIDTFDAGDGWMDFVPKGVSKGGAIGFLQSRLGVGTEETATFGDQENDISMFEVSGFSYGCEGGSAEALAAASRVISGPDKHGTLGIWEKIIESKGELV